jgi:drug/metabolite transporter (DMT)-like permease
MLLVVLLGLSAAVLLSVAAALQQHAAHRAAGTDTGGPLPLLRVAHRLVRSPIWVSGQVTSALGAGVQAVALHLGSVGLVQPLLATQLLFALPLGARRSRRWPRARDWLAAGAIVGALALFLTVRGAVPAHGHSDRHRLLAALAATIVLAGLTVTIATTKLGRRGYATLLAVGGALCSALSAVLLKVTAESAAERGAAATVTDWPAYALLVSILGALVLGQQAFASGSLAAAVTAGSITNPVASYLLGMLAFHAAPPRRAGALAALGGAAALLLAGAWGLARSAAVNLGGEFDAGPAGRSSEAGQQRQVLADHAGHADRPGARQRRRRVHRPGEHGVGGPAQFLDHRGGEQPEPDRHAVNAAAAQPGAQAGQLQRVAGGQDPAHVRLAGERVEHRPLLGAHRHRYARRVKPQRLGDLGGDVD